MQNVEAKILAVTYQDKMTVTRRHHVKNKKTHETEPQEVTVYQDAACALSVKTNNAPQKDSANNRNTINSSYTIFSPPDIWCRAGDFVVVATQEGQTYKGHAGRSMRYASHAETPFEVEEVV
jgi:hypothetical protein